MSVRISNLPSGNISSNDFIPFDGTSGTKKMPGSVITELVSHKNNQSNPHGVTKAQVGLGNADNTADEEKPVSTAQKSVFGKLMNAIATHGWNQLIKVDAYSESTYRGVTVTPDGNGKVSVVGTATGGSAMFNTGVGKKISAGHKYFLRGCQNGGSAGTYNLRLIADDVTVLCQDNGSGDIAEVNTLPTTAVMRIVVADGQTVNLNYYPQLIDLTDTFGVGKEPTLDECRKLFSMFFYPFCPKGNFRHLEGNNYFTKNNTYVSAIEGIVLIKENGIVTATIDVDVTGLSSGYTSYNIGSIVPEDFKPRKEVKAACTVFDDGGFIPAFVTIGANGTIKVSLRYLTVTDGRLNIRMTYMM